MLAIIRWHASTVQVMARFRVEEEAVLSRGTFRRFPTRRALKCSSSPSTTSERTLSSPPPFPTVRSQRQRTTPRESRDDGETDRVNGQLDLLKVVPDPGDRLPSPLSISKTSCLSNRLPVQREYSTSEEKLWIGARNGVSERVRRKRKCMKSRRVGGKSRTLGVETVWACWHGALIWGRS